MCRRSVTRSDARTEAKNKDQKQRSETKISNESQKRIDEAKHRALPGGWKERNGVREDGMQGMPDFVLFLAYVRTQKISIFRQMTGLPFSDKAQTALSGRIFEDHPAVRKNPAVLPPVYHSL